jgi:type IV pilus assembly protein PilB
LKVLIAEDDNVSRTVLKKTVEKLGHECLAAEDGLKAWEAYQNTPEVDVIISDWMMPNMDGLELCRRVRGLDRDDYTFFIYLTALGGKEHLLEGMQAGADEYLTKPLDGEQLRTKLIVASRVTSLHRHMKAEGTAEAVREPSDGSTRKSGVGATETARRAKPRVRGKAWDVLVSQGKLTEEQLQQALEFQKRNPMELGQVLVSLGFISEADLAQAQARRLNLDYVELTEANVDPEAVSLVPEKLLRKHGALPLYKEDGRLIVAMSDPTDVYALDDLRMTSHCSIVPVVTTEEDLQHVQAMVFSAGAQVAGMLEEAPEMEIEDEDEIELGAGTDAYEAPVVRLVNSILQRAVAEEASDIHLEPQAQKLEVRLRVDGMLREFMSVPPNLRLGVVARLKILGDLGIAERRLPQDGRFSVRLGEKKVDIRVATLPTVFGEEVVLRLLDTSNLRTDLTELGFAPRDLERYTEVFERPYGTILVTGPTGSGKSTTLYATLNRLNSPERKIITIEDPVEVRMRGINQIQVNPKAGLTFASGLRSILRNDPDVVMVGEIRDSETAKTGVEAALTGHLVLSTLHTNDAPAAVTRLTEMGVEPFLTATAVDCVIAQRLARRLCDRCKRPVEIDEDVLSRLDFPFEHLREGGARFHEAVGCEKCRRSGYRGRMGIYELLVVTDDLKDLILRRASTTEISRVAEEEGMTRLREDGLMKAARGITTIEEVLRTVV